MNDKVLEKLCILVILLLATLFRFFIFNSIHPVSQDFQAHLVIGSLNIILLWLIIRKRNNFVALVSSFLYAISPWAAYSDVFGSSFTLYLLFLLIFLFGFTFIKSKIFFMGIIIFMSVIFILYRSEISLFENVGLINSVNEFRGETNQTIFAKFGKLIENRYIYLSEHLIFNILKQFTPATYFTNQVPMFNFSFSPPIYLGFIIPFSFTLFELIKTFGRNMIFKLSLVILLMLPSILYKSSPDLSRLILISPVIFFIISKGLYELILNIKRKKFKFLIFITIFLVTLQFFLTLSDIAIREPVRYQALINQK